jgi:hypothetical protein
LIVCFVEFPPNCLCWQGNLAGKTWLANAGWQTLLGELWLAPGALARLA